MPTLLNQSKEISEKVREILNATKLKEILSEFGDLKLTGSLKWDVFWYGSDVDYTLIFKERLKWENVGILLQNLIYSEYFYSYKVAHHAGTDHFKIQLKKDLKTDYENGKLPKNISKEFLEKIGTLKVDIMILKEEKFEEVELEKLLVKLTDEQKENILKIKVDAINSGEKISGVEIYKRVLSF